MKIVSLLLLTLLIGVVLVANGAPQSSEMLTIICTDNCRGGAQFHFANLDPTVTYYFTGISTSGAIPGDTCCGGGINAEPDGTDILIYGGGLSSGNWDFTLQAPHNSGKLGHHPVAEQTLTVP
jgi:hypothetical protein